MCARIPAAEKAEDDKGGTEAMKMKYVGQCQLCSFMTEPLEDSDDAEEEVSNHIMDNHVDDFVDEHIEIIETEED